ncbi:ThiF family adenylyltransferase [Phytoactinopolyspora alkaliphila]|uniref:ThiF family adenylyltransferase n=1 Tax=Phytoactinopolyspora alkaliphila TaxID=1783498 RepID=A0A6N9YP96_9ACTN|nr:ThiF family adenylyltransferase [Phytoactinopolyspora alkaliphila]NED96866.1 ThiF family adenylyltransferase [Phytoactinopolyspora alkaliphila]
MGKVKSRLTDWQQQCLAHLRASAKQLPDTLTGVGTGEFDTETRTLHVPFSLNTSEIDSVPHGLLLEDQESFILAIGPDNEHPPAVYVDHFRFLGHPHVLSGFQFCLYLDETREWDPHHGINGVPNGVLNRLWRWLIKAAKAEFNADEALYHAVGGIPHLSHTGVPVPPIVVSELPQQRGRAASAWLTRRADWCLQLHASRPSGEEAEHMPVFFADHDLPFGAGSDYLYHLTSRLDLHQQQELQIAAALQNSPFYSAQQTPNPECEIGRRPFWVQNGVRAVAQEFDRSQSIAMLTTLAASAARKPEGTPQTLLLAVPHPQGGPRHLIAVYFDAELADHLRRLMRDKTGPLLTFDKARLDRSTPLKWCYVSDERDDVNHRRDIARPVATYHDTEILVLGVGGLGSWIAEFITRAGAAKITVCDTGIITGGLLVRQNYTDHDIGAAKADRLAERLRAIAPGIDIQSRHRIEDDELWTIATSANLIVDATINRAVARRLDIMALDPTRTAVIAQVATDAGTGSLGLAMVHGTKHSISALKTDVQTGHIVNHEPDLEPYRAFWKDPEPGDEFIPTRGCSLPTFHGSAADLAGVAASLTTLIAPHLADGESGAHLIALPHSGITPAYRYIPTSSLAHGSAA